MILLITNKHDITTDIVANLLNEYGAKYYRLNTEELALSVSVNLDFNKKKYVLFDNEKGISIDLNNVNSIYYRRPELYTFQNCDLSEGERQFCRNEIFYTLEGIYKVLRQKFWISPVWAIREAENKLYQIILADELGFKIPPSVVSTIPSEAKNFINEYENCIIKPIKTGLIKDEQKPQIIFTNLISSEHIEKLGRITNCPTYFQKNIPKEADIRVTVVGKKVFAARIDSQSFEDTKIDWRKGNNIHLKYSALELPSILKEKCVALVQMLNLKFGAIDFVLDNDGDFIFLEINPNGQWGWIEKRLGLGISEEIVSLLVKAGI